MRLTSSAVLSRNIIMGHAQDAMFIQVNTHNTDYYYFATQSAARAHAVILVQRPESDEANGMFEST